MGSASSDTPFTRVARRFCQLVEQRDKLDRDGLMCELHDVLPELLYCGSLLEWPASDVGGSLPVVLGEPDLAAIRHSLSALLADYDAYWEVFDPTRLGESPIRGSLSDDLADIYRDLKTGLAHIDGSVSAEEQSLWHWRFGYESHWGDHLVDAIRVVHTRMFLRLADA